MPLAEGKAKRVDDRRPKAKTGDRGFQRSYLNYLYIKTNFGDRGFLYV